MGSKGIGEGDANPEEIGLDHLPLLGYNKNIADKKDERKVLFSGEYTKRKD